MQQHTTHHSVGIKFFYAFTSKDNFMFDCILAIELSNQAYITQRFFFLASLFKIFTIHTLETTPPYTHIVLFQQ